MTDYQEIVAGYDQYGTTLCSLLNELMFEAGLQIHTVVHRVKAEESANRKLGLSPDKYSGLDDLTDLLGVRIITYFSDDVDRVAEVIKREFEIDKRNSVDKRKLLDTNQFGYLSLHYLASLKGPRTKLVEYKKYKDVKIEIQIRSILQHTWAEIEHDLGYKAEGAIPATARRRFSRIAGMLELADDEFGRLRDDLGEYEKHVRDSIQEGAPQTLRIDQFTVVVAVKNEEIFKKLDNAIAGVANRPLNKDVDSSYIADKTKDIKALGFENLVDLTEAAQRWQDHIVLFAKLWFEQSSRSTQVKMNNLSLPVGISLFYLSYVIVAQKKNDSEIKNWNITLRTQHPNILNRVRQVWKEVVEELGESSGLAP